MFIASRNSSFYVHNGEEGIYREYSTTSHHHNTKMGGQVEPRSGQAPLHSLHEAHSYAHSNTPPPSFQSLLQQAIQGSNAGAQHLAVMATAMIPESDVFVNIVDNINQALSAFRKSLMNIQLATSLSAASAVESSSSTKENSISNTRLNQQHGTFHRPTTSVDDSRLQNDTMVLLPIYLRRNSASNCQSLHTPLLLSPFIIPTPSLAPSESYCFSSNPEIECGMISAVIIYNMASTIYQKHILDVQDYYNNAHSTGNNNNNNNNNNNSSTMLTLRKTRYEVESKVMSLYKMCEQLLSNALEDESIGCTSSIQWRYTNGVESAIFDAMSISIAYNQACLYQSMAIFPMELCGFHMDNVADLASEIRNRNYFERTDTTGTCICTCSTGTTTNPYDLNNTVHSYADFVLQSADRLANTLRIDMRCAPLA